MKFEEVKRITDGVPYILRDNALKLYNFILKNQCTQILELGIAHGVASCFMAAALDEMKKGKITSVDLIYNQHDFKPSIEDLLGKLKLKQYVEVTRMQTGYNWFLHDEIKNQTKDNICIPKYDLCIIDGPKNWTIDSSAFFLADKLLKENGWIIFDDYSWTYEKADRHRKMSDSITHRELSEDERRLPHVKEIFHLLVMQHPSYSNFDIHAEGNWVWAQKKKSDNRNITFSSTTTLNGLIVKMIRKIMGRPVHY